MSRTIYPETQSPKTSSFTTTTADQPLHSQTHSTAIAISIDFCMHPAGGMCRQGPCSILVFFSVLHADKCKKQESAKKSSSLELFVQDGQLWSSKKQGSLCSQISARSKPRQSVQCDVSVHAQIEYQSPSTFPPVYPLILSIHHNQALPFHPHRPPPSSTISLHRLASPRRLITPRRPPPHLSTQIQAHPSAVSPNRSPTETPPSPPSPPHQPLPTARCGAGLVCAV
ncbi:hypothetical protein EDC01DRAFT_386955 [Geopyxis carbonaria]|nr:hypothetical protein EDC01DRAFT_386955 [Geopyxis carbonaria]